MQRRKESELVGTIITLTNPCFCHSLVVESRGDGGLPTKPGLIHQCKISNGLVRR